MPARKTLSSPAETWELFSINHPQAWTFGQLRHFPRQALSRDVNKWNHLAIPQNVSSFWRGGKQNAVVEWSKVKGGEYGCGDQGAGIEVNLARWWVGVFSKVGVSDIAIVD